MKRRLIRLFVFVFSMVYFFAVVKTARIFGTACQTRVMLFWPFCILPFFLGLKGISMNFLIRKPGEKSPAMN